MFELNYKGVFDIPGTEGTCVITLTDVSENRALSIMTDRTTALKFKEHLAPDSTAPKDDMVDLLYFFLLKDGAVNYYRAVIDAKKDLGFNAYLEDVSTGERLPLKPDQAVLLAVVSGMQLWATQVAVSFFSTPYNAHVQTVALPILSLPDSMLKRALDQAIQDENYESASFIRDEINRRAKAHKLDNE